MPADLEAWPETSSTETTPESVNPSLLAARRTFAAFALGVLIFTVVSILYGAFVRVSFSGDGCGTSWPLCDGTVLPVGARIQTYIELAHRYSTSLLGFVAIGLYLFARRLFPKGDAVRKAAGWGLVFTITAGIIGMLLVLFSWVTTDKSAQRVVAMPLHLINTFGLIAACTLTVHFARGGQRVRLGSGPVSSAIKWAAGAFVAIGMTGAISALGKTAYAKELSVAGTLLERLNMHVGDKAAPILKGGVLHPFIATAAGLVILFAVKLAMDRRDDPRVQMWGKWTIGLYVVQMAFGIFNLVLSAPAWMQIGHLGFALANWITFVMLAAYALPRPSMESGEERASEPEEKMNFKEAVRAYFALTKPRVISLLLFTTIAAMFIGERGAPPLWLIIVVTIGGYMAAGAANAYNMAVEQDLDVAMKRTSHRPTVTHRISTRSACIFATIMAIGSFVLLWTLAHPIAAVMALCGLLCYVFVYTLWLKRRTWHNIVIGGAAGAFPPLVGYAAVTGDLSPYAWFLFALIFTWTPVHFWALAILIKDDYAAAGVPMLPVVKGDRVTVVQIGIYAIITVLLCALPLLQGMAGPIYIVGAGLLNLGLIVQCVGLWRHADRQHARAVFKYSMVYLALIFVVIAIDRVWTV